MSYNERGNSTGMATITFRSADQASLAVKKFHNAPIDGGKNKLRLNLIVDPNRKTLLDRIQPVRNNAAAPKKAALANRAPQKKSPVGPNKKAIAAKQKKRAKPEKKSLEDLDKEMADYFEESK